MLEQEIAEDLKAAMKAKDALRVGTIRLLINEIKNYRINNRVESVDNATTLSILKKQVKQRQDSIEQFDKAGRTDLSDKEKAEITIIQAYLPEELSADQVTAIIEDVIRETNASSMKDMGIVMKMIKEKTNGRTDNKLVSQIVKAKLG